MILQSEPSSGINTRILCLTSRNYTPNKHTTPTATIATVAAVLPSLSVQATTPPRHDELELERLDIEAESRADGDHPFPVDRRAIKEVVLDKLGVRVERVSFLSAGTFHKVRQ